MSDRGSIERALSRAFDLLTGDLVAALLRGAGFPLSGIIGAVEVSRPIDARIARLDEARSALSDSLAAIDELRGEAASARAEHAVVLQNLESTLASKDDAEQKLASIRRIISEDVQSFREVAGVSDVRKERLIGFGSGVAASVVATALWAWGGQLIALLN